MAVGHVCGVIYLWPADNRLGADGTTGLGQGLGSVEGLRDLKLSLKSTCA